MPVEDSRDVEQAARDLLARYDAVRAAQIAREQAEIADEVGDALSAQAWRDIVAAIERLA
jgi:hypothetical protein